jgi:hypothetical protein
MTRTAVALAAAMLALAMAAPIIPQFAERAEQGIALLPRGSCLGTQTGNQRRPGPAPQAAVVSQETVVSQAAVVSQEPAAHWNDQAIQEWAPARPHFPHPDRSFQIPTMHGRKHPPDTRSPGTGDAAVGEASGSKGRKDDMHGGPAGGEASGSKDEA